MSFSLNAEKSSQLSVDIYLKFLLEMPCLCLICLKSYSLDMFPLKQLFIFNFICIQIANVARFYDLHVVYLTIFFSIGCEKLYIERH